MNQENYDGLERTLREELRRNASISPAARLDRRILRRVRRRTVLKPFLAGSIAVAGLTAMITGLTVLYADSELPVEPIMAAALTSLIYLAVCSVAVLPVLIFPVRPGPALQLAKETP